MNHASRLIVVATIFAFVCNGCATKALMKAAGESSGQKYPGTVRLISASSDDDTGYLCFQRSTPDARIETYLARIPVAGSKSFYVSSAGYRQSVVKIAADQISQGACETHGKSMPIIEISDQYKFRLGADQKEAMYVKYAEGGLQSLGYVSANPFYNRSLLGDSIYSYAIDLGDSGILSMGGQKRPYLLLLLPVTVTADVVSGVAVGVFAIAYLVVRECSKTPGGCKGGS
ncbi:MAG TPA: hypothetical protein VLC92_02480 [Rhodocyclaceae bacterium]|nr:hypothetical protein [Rhodocyclaceae bacterium]